MGSDTLQEFLDGTGSTSTEARAIAELVKQLAVAAAAVSAVIAQGDQPLTLPVENAATSRVESERRLNAFDHNAFLEAARKSSVANVLSENEVQSISLSEGGSLALAIDPLEGSSNIAVNSPCGTIFGIYPAAPGDPASSFLRKGRDLLAAGYFIYGARTKLVLSLGGPPKIFAFSAPRAEWIFAREGLIPKSACEFAINMSNYRFWSERERQFVDQCLDGEDGPLAVNYNMRWLAALVGETHRIFQRGGIYFYPADSRPGYQKGRLHYVYECAPIAYLVEKGGGVANDGATAILDLLPATLHGHSALCFGSIAQMQLFADAKISSERQYSPLFSKRGLFRSGL